jgi:hypothetical protein
MQFLDMSQHLGMLCILAKGSHNTIYLIRVNTLDASQSEDHFLLDASFDSLVFYQLQVSILFLATANHFCANEHSSAPFI